MPEQEPTSEMQTWPDEALWDFMANRTDKLIRVQEELYEARKILESRHLNEVHDGHLNFEQPELWD